MSSRNNANLTVSQLSLFHDNNLEKLVGLLKGDLNFHNQVVEQSGHNFHSFPAKFPPQLPKFFIEGLTRKGDVVLDPMAGSGTTILEAFLAERQAWGFDIDPLALNIIRVKTTPADSIELLKLTKRIVLQAAEAVHEKQDELKADIAKRFDEETMNFINHWFFPTTQIELQAIFREIEIVENPVAKAFFELCFSAIIITKSGGVSLALDLGHTRPHMAKKVIDKSGNILIGNHDESVPPYATKILRLALPEFEKKCLQNLEGILKPQNGLIQAQVKFGNAQNLSLPASSVDLIVTSPPYASNAIDYMRAHKFSLVWLGYPIENLGQWRRNYIGGEATNDFEFERLPEHSQGIVDTISQADSKKGLSLHRYYSEMKRVFGEMYRVLKPGKAAIVVVGNSLMRGIDTEVPFCLAEIGAEHGFDVPLIGIRELDRDKRMMPAGTIVNLESQIQQRMHEEHVIGFYKP